VNNPKLTFELVRNEFFVRRLFDVLKAAKEIRPNEVRLSDVLSLCLRFDNHILRSDMIKGFLKRVYDLSRASRETQEYVQDAPFISYFLVILH